jgi:NADPH2:quinone reductase
VDRSAQSLPAASRSWYAEQTVPVRAITVQQTGGPEVLAVDDGRPNPEPGPGDLVVRVAAAGVNFVDTYHRTGLYPRPLPFVPGAEGAGTVVAVGADVEDFATGDLVAWSDAPESYAELVGVPAARAVPVPEGVDPEVAAAAVLQGLTAHFLIHDAYPLRAGDRCLIHAAAGGVGRLAVQLAKGRGAEVFATVGSPEKAQLVRAAGADHVIDYRAEDFGDAVEAVAGPRALDVVYDGVGRTTFARGLDLLRPRGTMVTFGNASGAVDPVAPLTLMQKGSLFLTRPTLHDYVATTQELRARAADLFGAVATGALDVRIGARLPLADAAEAHRLLESRTTTGKLLLIP